MLSEQPHIFSLGAKETKIIVIKLIFKILVIIMDYQVILDTLMVREFSPGWISLDITAAVDEWRKR